MAGCPGEAARVGLAPGAGGQAGVAATDIWEGCDMSDGWTALAICFVMFVNFNGKYDLYDAIIRSLAP